ncbi:MAG TPA: potassium transporter TrkG [bacterium]|nr:potassium transporter TrkG [bacterium]
MNYKIIAKLLGLLIIIIGFSMLFAFGWGVYYNEPETEYFGYSIVICLSCGGLLYYLNKNAETKMYRREAYIVVGLGWIVAGFFGALPYIMTDTLNTFADAIFESISGFTTTGSTVLSDIEAVSKCILFWRSLTHWLGGMGIIVLFVALFPFLGVGGKYLLKNETPGPVKEGIKNKTVHSARYLWYIYLAISALLTILLLLGGMSWFDALCHTFGTMATGGFSTLNKSVGGYNSRYFEIVITIFMFMAGVNFTLYYNFLGGRWKTFFKDIEFKVYAFIILVCTILTTGLLYYYKYYPTILSSLRYAAFQVVSIITTTGFGTADFNIWPPFCQLLFVSLMFFGGCAGSTGGGMKIIRIIILFKYAIQQVLRSLHPTAVYVLKIENHPFPKQTMHQILGFFVFAIGIFVFSSLFVALHNIDIITSTTSVAATLWNIGPGLAKVGAVENFGFLPETVKYFLSLLMIIGRLEIFTIIVFFIPDFWK